MNTMEEEARNETADKATTLTEHRLLYLTRDWKRVPLPLM